MLALLTMMVQITLLSGVMLCLARTTYRKSARLSANLSLMGIIGCGIIGVATLLGLPRLWELRWQDIEGRVTAIALTEEVNQESRATLAQTYGGSKSRADNVDFWGLLAGAFVNSMQTSRIRFAEHVSQVSSTGHALAIASVLGFFALQVTFRLLFFALAMRGRPLRDTRLENRLQELATRARLSGRLRILTCKSLNSPCVGWFATRTILCPEILGTGPN